MFLSYAEDFGNCGILLNYIFNLKNLGFMPHDLFSKDFINADYVTLSSLVIVGRSCQAGFRFT